MAFVFGTWKHLAVCLVVIHRLQIRHEPGLLKLNQAASPGPPHRGIRPENGLWEYLRAPGVSAVSRTTGLSCVVMKTIGTASALRLDCQYRSNPEPPRVLNVKDQTVRGRCCIDFEDDFGPTGKIHWALYPQKEEIAIAP
jgi:hypothetical protein